MVQLLPSLCLAALVTSAAAQKQADWDGLSKSVEGRLYPLAPLALPCFSQHDGEPSPLDQEACDAVRGNYTNNAFRVARPNGYTFLQNEICVGDEFDQCLLDGSEKPAAQPEKGSSCNQGSVPSRYIEVRRASDVAAAFKFSKKHGVPLAIKNSGHDLMMRNSQKGGLELFVGKLQDKEFYEDFVPEGCKKKKKDKHGGGGVGRAVTVGTGSPTASVHEFLKNYDSTFVGGYSGSVSSSGGWVQGGGHSILSTVYGLGADRVVQFRVVTPDGKTRIANRCQNTDLFWALRGGGGGTFGVVLDATHRVEKASPVAWAMITIPRESSDEVVLQWLELQARESLQWGRQGWGGHVGGLYVRRVNPLAPIASLDDEEAVAAKKSLDKAIEFALAHNGTSTVEVLPTFYDVWAKHIEPSGLENSGAVRFMSTRLLPQSMFEDEEGIEKIVEYIKQVRAMGYDPRDFYISVGAPYVADPVRGKACAAQKETSVSPAWYTGLWQAAVRFDMKWNATLEERIASFKTLGEATLLQEELTGPEGGSYGLETNPFTTGWRESWWGEKNYARLLKIKKKYDPHRLLNCWKCVGFEEDLDLGSGGGDDGYGGRFGCGGRMQAAIDAVVDV